MGKTTMTREAATPVRDDRKFGHRRWFVELETAPNAEALEKAIIVALGLDPASARFDAALARLGQAPGLLVLDNLETPWDGEREKVEAVLASLHRVPQLALLASIRGNEPPAGVRWTRQRTMHPLEAPHDSRDVSRHRDRHQGRRSRPCAAARVARRRSDRDRTGGATGGAARHARRRPCRMAARRQRAGQAARRRAVAALFAGSIAGIVIPVPAPHRCRAAAVLHSRPASGRHGAGGREGAARRRGLRGAAGTSVDRARRRARRPPRPAAADPRSREPASSAATRRREAMARALSRSRPRCGRKNWLRPKARWRSGALRPNSPISMRPNAPHCRPARSMQPQAASTASRD